MRSASENSLYVLNSVLGQTSLKDWVQSITQAVPSYASPMPNGDFIAFMFLVDKPAPAMSEDTVLELVTSCIFIYPGPNPESAHVVLGVPLEVLENSDVSLQSGMALGKDILCRN